MGLMLMPGNPFRPGDEVTAATLAVRSVAIRSASASFDAATNLESIGTGRGVSARDSTARPILGFLVGDGPTYSFVQVIDQPGGSIDGGYRRGICYEVNGVTGLGGQVHRLYPDRSGGYRFQFVGRGPTYTGGPGSGCMAYIFGRSVAIPAADVTLDWYTNQADSFGDFTGTLLAITTDLVYDPTEHHWQSAPFELPFPSIAFSINNSYGNGLCPYAVVSLACGGGLTIRTGTNSGSIGDSPCGGPGTVNMVGGAIPTDGEPSPFFLQYGAPGSGVGPYVFANGILTG